MLSLFVEQLNAFYKVTGKPLITLPLSKEHEYLVACELARTCQGLTPLVEAEYCYDIDVQMVGFLQQVFEDLKHEAEH